MSKLRAEKVQELIKQEISMMLISDIKDPRVKNVTVTGVEVTNDLSYAKIFVSLFGSDEEQEKSWIGLNKALGFIRSEIAKRISLRVAPTLILSKDTSGEYSSHIQELLNKIKKEDNKNDE